MINIAICDDSERAVDVLKKYIDKAFKHYTNDYSIKTFTNGTMLLTFHSIKKIQILFLEPVQYLSAHVFSANFYAELRQKHLQYVSITVYFSLSA